MNELLDLAVWEAKREYRGMKIKPQHISGVSSKNVMVLLMYIVMRERNATDFGLSGAAPLTQIPDFELQLHHIFPFDFTMKDQKALQYQKEQGLSLRDYRNRVNDVANLTFLSQAKNASIGSVSPWQYLPNETTEDMRRQHFIREDKDLWTPENFGRFLELRREILAEAMNRLLRRLA